MNTNETFYKGTQAALKDFYSQMTLENYQEQTDLMIKRLGKISYTSLELGAGVGLVAIDLNLRGATVTALDFDETVHQIAQVNQEKYGSQVEFIQADFYQFQPSKKFDLVYYLDGFGLGSDDDQLKLLKQIHTWLKPEGRAYIEVYQPDYWRKAAGQQMALGSDFKRVYAFDEKDQAMVDTWTQISSKQSFVQKLRCYKPDRMSALASQANLKVDAVFPNGKMDYKTMQYYSEANIDECMSYALILSKSI